MEVVEPATSYWLNHLDGQGKTKLCFVARLPHHAPAEGVSNQEVLRVLIDRVQTLNEELPWEGNAAIVHHLRMALVLHEARALVRDVEKGVLKPELVPVDEAGHFIFGDDET